NINTIIAKVEAINAEVNVVNAEDDDRQGNILVRGIVGAQKEAALAATTLIVTVEEIVESLAAPMNAIVLPHWVVTAIAEVPTGAYPSYAHGYYTRDNAFYLACDGIARDRERSTAWITR